MKRIMIFAVGLLFVLASCAEKSAEVVTATSEQGSEDELSYDEQIAEWQKNREESLRAEGGWLSVVGLEWIEEGENSFGSAKSSAVALPEGKAPESVGTITLANGKVTLEAWPDANVLKDGAPVTSIELLPDSAEETTVLELGTLSFHVIQRGDRFALRVKDKQAPALEKFEHIARYDTDESWKIEGTYIPYDPPKEVEITNIVGLVESSPLYGSVEFQIDGETYRLDPLQDSADDTLFLIFSDATSGTETYGAGRYIYTEPPGPDGKVIIDFNKAYNPPCVFTAFATCPLPPLQNRLTARIGAGEKMWGPH